MLLWHACSSKFVVTIASSSNSIGVDLLASSVARSAAAPRHLFNRIVAGASVVAALVKTLVDTLIGTVDACFVVFMVVILFVVCVKYSYFILTGWTIDPQIEEPIPDSVISVLRVLCVL